MKERKHFVAIEFFVCPECGKGIVEKEKMKKERKHYADSIYCMKCGKEIANAYKEALAKLEQD